jgi:hypothetical protein
MTGRAKRVFVYTAALLSAPLPLMPWERGTRESVVALVPCGLVLALGSLYVLRGELGGPRGLLGNKLVAASSITLLFGASLVVGSAVYLLRGLR